MALAGGFLVPILLSTGRDQYGILFTYITLLDLGMLGAVIGRTWRGIGSLAYVGTQFLFWAWYTGHYHSEKRAGALLFQAAIFLLFLLADLAPHLRRRASGVEEWVRLAVNPFVFYATCYGLLNDDHHEWMAALALLLALVYAALARAELALRPMDRRMLLVTLGTALTFSSNPTGSPSRGLSRQWCCCRPAWKPARGPCACSPLSSSPWPLAAFCSRTRRGIRARHLLPSSTATFWGCWR
jgi:uncharacterized membrane protein